MKVNPYYSISQEKKPPKDRIYHNNDECSKGRDIPISERRRGTIGRLCRHCQDLNAIADTVSR